jgi:hypothetical protein
MGDLRLGDDALWFDVAIFILSLLAMADEEVEEEDDDDDEEDGDLPERREVLGDCRGDCL